MLVYIIPVISILLILLFISIFNDIRNGKTVFVSTSNLMEQHVTYRIIYKHHMFRRNYMDITILDGQRGVYVENTMYNGKTNVQVNIIIDNVIVYTAFLRSVSDIVKTS